MGAPLAPLTRQHHHYSGLDYTVGPGAKKMTCGPPSGAALTHPRCGTEPFLPTSLGGGGGCGGRAG